MSDSKIENHPLKAKLPGLPFIEQLIHLDQTESTNLVAKGLPACKPGNFRVVWAKRQIGGRGRRGRSFFSSHEGGLWVSILLGVDCMDEHFLVNRALSLSICKSIEDCGGISDVEIKWPNDIYIEGKKVCGILLETVPGLNNALVAGFGINVEIAPQDFPPIIRETATSVSQYAPGKIDKDELLVTILTTFHHLLELDGGKLHDEYRGRLYGINRQALVDGKEWCIRDVDDSGRLVVYADGTTKHLLSGTVTFI